MSGAALGIVTALALAASALQESRGSFPDFHFGARRHRSAQQPRFQPPPTPSTSVEPRVVCRTPVVHGNAEMDSRFVIPVPKGAGVPRFTMRWAPSEPCDPAREQGAKDETPVTPRR